MGKFSIVRSAGIISACTLLSRLLGLVRDILGARLFGTGSVWDAFALAFAVPNLFRRLFGEGALTAAFIPAFVERYDSDRREEAHALLNKLLSAMGIVLGLIVGAGIVVTFLLPADPRTAQFAELLRIMLPYLVFICVAAILGAALNALRHYFTFAFAPVLLNVVWIGSLLLFGADAEALAWAVVIGGALQLLVLVPPLRARGIPLRPRLDMKDPALREVGRQFLPLVFGLALVQVNEVVARIVAWLVVPDVGAVSTIYYGYQITQLPLALIGTAVGTAVFPLFASPKEDFQDVFRRSLRLVLFVSVPATLGLILLAEPTVRLLFERDEFKPEDTVRVAGFVTLYAAGLWCFCANNIQVRAFYAKKDTRTPVKVSATMVLLNFGLVMSLVWTLEERGIALASSATGLATFLALNALFRRKHGEVDLRPIYAALGRILLASIAMGAAVWGAYQLMSPSEDDTIGPKLAHVFVPLAAGVVVYLAAARLLGLDEARLLLRRSNENR